MSGSNLSRIKNIIEAEGIALGVNARIPNLMVCDILCSSGFDFIWIDGEHSPMGKKDIFEQVILIRRAGLAPFVRVPWNDPVILKPVLDMGPAAVIIPFIRNAEEANRAVEACKYPPEGIRGWGPIKADDYRVVMTKEEYIEMSKSEPWIILQIEDINGVEDIADIIKVDGVDTISIGPNDLSWSLGLSGKADHPEVQKQIDRISVICNEHDFPFGTAVSKCSEQDMENWIRRGISWVSIGSDQGFLVSGAKNINVSKRQIIERLK